MKDLLLYSCGSDLIVDFIEVCAKNKTEIVAVINNIEGFESKNVSNTISLSELGVSKKAPFLVPLFTPKNRFLASNEALEKGLIPFSILNDKNNDLPLTFSHGKGCFINKRVVIGSESKIGDFVLINRGACLGHHLDLSDYVSIGPGVTTGGGVKINRGALIGTGATILPEIEIGKNAIVGAGAVVTKNVPDNALVVGNPAKQVSENKNPF